jgi:hypothetical protein
VLIALLAVLGVDLITIVVFVAAVLARREWLSHQPGAFRGIATVTDGKVRHLGSRARRGYGRWVRDVLVWTPGPLFLRNALAPFDRSDGTKEPDGRVRRLGKEPRVVQLSGDGVHVEITVRAADAGLVTVPFPAANPAPTAPTAPTAPAL